MLFTVSCVMEFFVLTATKDKALDGARQIRFQLGIPASAFQIVFMSIQTHRARLTENTQCSFLM